jgi:hypothetical protein
VSQRIKGSEDFNNQGLKKIGSANRFFLRRQTMTRKVKLIRGPIRLAVLGI